MEEFELYILNDDFAKVCLVDTFESMIWTDRYKEPGDFELYLPVTSQALVYAVHGYYLYNKDSEKLMIIEKTEIETDNENGNHLKITGRSLESILSRRVVWFQTTMEGNAAAVIKKLITDAFISPDDASDPTYMPDLANKRRIENFSYLDTGDTRFDTVYEQATGTYVAGTTYYEGSGETKTMVDTTNFVEGRTDVSSYYIDVSTFRIELAQFLGENILDVVNDICSQFDIGYKLIYDWELKEFVFSLYCGNDRSYQQNALPWVIFSPSFDNLLNTNYVEDSTNVKNVNLIAGEEPDSKNKKRFFVSVGDATGIDRKEMYTDGSSIKQEYTNDSNRKITLTDGQYAVALKSQALTELAKSENQFAKSFEGEVIPNRGFKLGVDYFLGDIVQIENEYGMASSARVNEIIFSQSTSGIEMYPTFSIFNNE